MAEDLRSQCGHSRNVRLKTPDGTVTTLMAGDVLTCRFPGPYLRITRKNPNSSSKKRVWLQWDRGRELCASKLKLEHPDQFEELCHLIGVLTGLKVRIIYRKNWGFHPEFKCRFE